MCKQFYAMFYKPLTTFIYSSALQPVCTVHPRVHQNMRGVQHYERVNKDALQTYHAKQILFTKTLCYQNEPI